MEKTIVNQKGQEIRDIRIRTGLTQKDFAKLLRCPMRTLQDWETGKREIPLYELFWMKAYVDKDEEELCYLLEHSPEYAGLDLKAGWKIYVDLFF